MRVLMTGSAGNMGQILVRGLKDKFELRGFDLKPTPGLDDQMVGDLANFDAVLQASEGMEGVIHLGGHPKGDEWEPILHSNIIGTYNLFEAAHQNGVRRIAYASRAGLVGPYPEDVMRTADLRPRPNSFYSVSKVFGEAVAYRYASRSEIEVVCVRISNIKPERVRPKGTKIGSTGHFLSHDDCVHLFEQCLIQPAIKYEIVYGVSNCSPSRYDLEYARKILGYNPKDKMQDFIEKD